MSTTKSPEVTTIERGLSPHVARVLAKVHPSKWHLFVLRLDSESGEVSVLTRGELAAWLKANDLPELAREAESRRVPRGCLLALVLRDTGPVWHTFFK